MSVNQPKRSDMLFLSEIINIYPSLEKFYAN